MSGELAKPSRSDIMRAVRRRDTGPEVSVRRIAHRLGLRFRLCVRELPGSPDLVFPKYRIALFVHGCFWHRHAGCSRASTPKTRAEFWQHKFDMNVQRDSRAAAALADIGWRAEVIWECTTKSEERIEEQLRAIFRLPSSGSGK